jgi:hypothetical protein
MAQGSSSPRRACILIRSAVRQAIAWIVNDGLAPPTVGKTDPSQIHKLGMSQLRQSSVTRAALLLLTAAAVELALGLDAEGKSLESIADPLSQ